MVTLSRLRWLTDQDFATWQMEAGKCKSWGARLSVADHPRLMASLAATLACEPDGNAGQKVKTKLKSQNPKSKTQKETQEGHPG